MEDILLKNNQIYMEKIERGMRVAMIIDKGVVREESLTREYDEALRLYRKQKPRIQVAGVELRAWQQDLMRIMQQDGGTNRKVYWISGSKGNEGKSWMQCYVEAYYGYSRVIRLEIRNKTSNNLHALTKRPLQTTDIFLFKRATNRLSLENVGTFFEQISIYGNMTSFFHLQIFPGIFHLKIIQLVS